MNKDNIESSIRNYDQTKKQLEARFSNYKSGRRLRVFIKSVLASFISAAALLIVFLLVERTPIQSEMMRYVFSSVLYIGVVCWIYRLFSKWFNAPSDVSLAVEIENSTGHFNSSLSSAVEFMEKTENSKSVSSLMKKLTIITAGEELKNEDISLSLKAFSRRKRVFASLAFILIIIGWYLFSPVEVRTGAFRLIFPFAAIAPWSNLSLEVAPKNAVAAVGESIEISAVPSRKTDEAIILEIIDPETKEVNKVEMYADATASEAKYVYNLTSLQNSIDYRITCEKTASEKYSIEVMPRPQIKKVVMTLFQPSYISTKPIKLPENTNETEILLNSKIRIDVEADMPIKSGEICFDNIATQSCQVIENKFNYEFKVATSTSFVVSVSNEIGLTNEKAVVYKITAKPDLPPSIELLKPGCDVEFPTAKRLDIKAVARDDFGVKTMVLYFKAGHREDWKPLNVKSDFTPLPECEIEFPWMLDTIAVQPGTKISYYMETEDACQPKANVASTSIFFVNMPSMQDVYKGQDNQQADLKKQLQEYIEEQKIRSESLRKAYEQVKHEEKLDFETSQAIEEAIKSGEKNQQAAEEILKSFENMQKSMENNPFTSPEALERMQKVQELLDKVLDKESKQMLKNLQESLKDIKLDPKDIQKYEEAFKLEDYMNSLDRTINLLEQVQEQQKFESLANSIEELFERQQKIASETEELMKKQKQSELTEEDVSKKLDDLKNLLDKQKEGQLTQNEEEKLKELKEQQSELEKLQELLQKQKEGKELSQEEQKEMKELQQALQEEKKDGLTKEEENRLKDLQDQQKKISQDLEELQKKSEEMTKESKKEDLKNNPLMEDVKNILDQMKNKDHKKLGEEIQKEMQNKNLDMAKKNQEKMLNFLEALKKNANQMMDMMGGEPTQLDLSYYISRAIKVSKDQEKLLREIIDMPDQFMRGKMPQIEGIIDYISVQQVLVKQQGLSLQEDLNQLIRGSFAIDPVVVESINGTQQMFSDIVKNLEDRALDSSRRDQYEIMRRFNKLAADLMRAQDNSGGGSSSSSPMTPMQQFKNLTRRQLSLYQQMMKQQLMPKGGQALKEMAMEQRHIRESLEQLMREHRQQMNNLGRMNDVIDDMKDLETKILDPSLREKVAEKQKSIYERMLKSQKAIKNRDEEDEERKAHKAREIYQQEPEKPIGDIGSGSIDVSKDFTGDLREEYPESYKNLINDYYKSLNIYGGEQR